MSAISMNLTIPQKFEQIEDIEGLKRRFPVLPDSDIYKVETNWNKPLAIASAILAALAAHLYKQAQLHAAIGCGFTAVLISTQIRTKIQIPTDAIKEQSKQIDELFSDFIKELDDQWKYVSQLLSDDVSNALKEGRIAGTGWDLCAKANEIVYVNHDKYLLGKEFDGMSQEQQDRITAVRKLVPLARQMVKKGVELHAKDSGLNDHVFREFVKVCVASQRFLHGRFQFGSGIWYVDNQYVRQSNSLVTNRWSENEVFA